MKSRDKSLDRWIVFTIEKSLLLVHPSCGITNTFLIESRWTKKDPGE